VRVDLSLQVLDLSGKAGYLVPATTGAFLKLGKRRGSGVDRRPSDGVDRSDAVTSTPGRVTDHSVVVAHLRSAPNLPEPATA
jgi:hypothetical protein